MEMGHVIKVFGGRHEIVFRKISILQSAFFVRHFSCDQPCEPKKKSVYFEIESFETVSASKVFITVREDGHVCCLSTIEAGVKRI